MVYIMAVQSLFRAHIRGRDGKGTRAGKQRLFRAAGILLTGMTVPRASPGKDANDFAALSPFYVRS
jgi:hypothetical protein